jgi:hypothetical protein
MMLTKRNYLGIGSVRTYINNDTLDYSYVRCTDEDYEEHEESGIIPEMDGYTFSGSNKGVILVESPTFELGENEYCDFEGEYFAVISSPEYSFIGKVGLDKIINNEYIK